MLSVETLDWNQLIPAILVTGTAIVTGRWVWSKLPKKDMGAAALASVNAARAAVELSEQVHEERLEHLEERVLVLETLLIEKEGIIERQNEKIRSLESEMDLLLRWIAALSEQLTQAGIQPISRDRAAANRRRDL